MKLRRPLALTTAATMLALAGCGSGSAGSGSASGSGREASVDIPEGWTYVEGEDVPEVEAEPQLPVTATDGNKVKVEVDDASEIIVGGDDVAAILGGLGMGDLVKAAPTNSASQVALDAPEEFEFSQESGPEGLLGMDGTLFIGNNVKRHGSIAQSFNKAGTDAVVLDDQQSVPDKIRDLGSYLGVDSEAKTMAEDVEKQLKEAGEIAEDEGVEDLKVLQVTSDGAGGANAVVGTGTAGADIAEAIGVTSVGVDTKLRGYSVQYSDEGLLETQPDVILVGTADLEEWGGEKGFNEAFPTLKDTPAGKKGNVIVMPSEEIKVSGPATGAGAVALAEALADLGE